MIRSLALLLVCVLMGGCIELGRSWSDTVETRYVDYYKEQCDSASSGLCFRVRENSSDSWAVVAEPFSGFSSFVWGYRYTIKVTVSHDDNGHPDSYSFREIVSAEAVAESEDVFGLTLYSDAGVLYAADASSWELGGEISFACNEACAELDSAVANSYVLQLEFSVSNGVISLDNLLCAAAENEFSSHCEGESTESWRVAWFQSDCGLADAQMCLLYKVNNSDDYELLQLESDVEDFSPTWGERYDIDVVKTASNGGNITSVVLSNDDSSPDDLTGSVYPFYFVVRGIALDNSSSGLITLYDGAPDLDCSSFNLCSKLDDYIDDDQWLLLRGYVDGDIVLSSITCHSASLTSFRSCVDDVGDVNWGI